MGERFFTIKEATRVLGCHRATVYRLLAEGWLNRPCGGSKLDRTARVTQKSVFQLLIIDCLSHFPAKTLREFKSRRKNFARLLSQNLNASCFSSSEDLTPQPPSLKGKGETGTPINNQSQRCLHHDFAAEHQFSFGWMARQLVGDGDLALQDDLVQEMSLAVFQYDKPAGCEYLLTLAENRAKNYLKYEAQRGMLSLEEAREETDSFEAKMESLRNLIEALIGRGVPAAWIDEILGTKFETHGTGGQATSGTRSSELENGLADAG